MIYQQKNETEEDVVKASYLLGTSNSLKVKFDFKIPTIPDNYLVPISSKVGLVRTNLASINQNTVLIPWSVIDVSSITASDFLRYETTFRINGIIDNSLLEQYLKKCKTVYSLKGGEDGVKEFYMYDSIHITVHKEHLIMRKYITLNRSL